MYSDLQFCLHDEQEHVWNMLSKRAQPILFFTVLNHCQYLKVMSFLMIKILYPFYSWKNKLFSVFCQKLCNGDTAKFT